MSTSAQYTASLRLTADASQYSATMKGAAQTWTEFGHQVQLGTAGATTGMHAVVTQADRIAPALATTGKAAEVGLKGATTVGQSLATTMGVVGTQAERIAPALATTGKAAEVGLKGATTVGQSLATTMGAVGSAGQRAGAASAQGMAQATMSTKAYQAALRQVPMQMTDIVVGLTSGQSPFTVLMQQGGQLKDTLGGVVPAIRALSGYVMGMVNPFSLSAVAMAALGAAAYSGSQESHVLQNAIINSGNAAGVTRGQLMGMAAGVDAVVGTQGRAVEVLSAFVATGRVGAQHLQEFTAAAMRFEEVGGAGAEETAKAFAELGKAPLEASLKFNEAMHYLTASTYAQIKALMEQGRTTEAADVAQKAFADTINSRSGQMAANLGLVEKGWKGIAWAVSEAWDALKAIGRDGGQEAALKSVEDELAKMKSGKYAWAFGMSAADRKAAIAEREQEVSAQRKSLKVQQDASAEQAKQAKLTEQIVDWDKKGDQFASTKQKRDDEISKARVLGQALINAGKLTEQQLTERIAAIREKYTDKSLTGDSELANLKARVAAETKNLGLLQLQGLHYDKLNDGERTALQLAEQLNGKLDAKTRKSKEAQLVQAQALADVLTQQEAQRKLLEAKAAAMALDEKLTAQQVTQYQQSIEQLISGNEQLRQETDLIGKDTAAQRTYLAAKAQEVITAKELEVINLRNAGARDEVIANAERELRLLREKVTLTGQVNTGQDTQVVQEMLKDLGRETAALTMTNEQRQVAIALRELENRGIKAGSEAYDEYIPKIKAAIANKSAVEKGIEFWGSIESTAKGVWTSVADGGVNAFARIGQTLKSAVLDMLWQMTGRQWLISIGTTLGVPGAALAGQQGGAGGVGGTVGQLSSMGSLYNAMTNGVSASVTAGFTKLMSGDFGQKIGMSYYDGNAYQLTGTGQSVGAALGAAGNAMAGYGLQKAISGGYKTGESGLVDAITVAASAYFGPLAGVAAGVFNRAFGRKLADTGIEGSFGGAAGFTGQQYQFYKGGWFRSDKTDYSAMDAGMQSGFAQQFKAQQVQTGLMAQALGQGTDAIANFTSSVKISFQGLTEAQITEKLQAQFSATSDSLASLVLGGSDFAKMGETSTQTLTRLSTSLTTLNQISDTLGWKLESVSLAGGDAASTFADLFGSLDAMATATSSYYDAFYSQSERNATSVRQLTKQLSDLGVELPATRDAYRALVDDALAKGNDQLASDLIKLSGAYASVTDATDQATSSIAAYLDRLSTTSSTGGTLTVAAAQGQFATQLAAAKTGDATALGNLSTYADAVIKAATEQLPWLEAALVQGQVRSELSGLLTGARAFATGGMFPGGGIVSGPTAFPLGLMGEAGKEAIMPLANVGGSLGVRMTGGPDFARLGVGIDAIVEQIKSLRALVATLKDAASQAVSYAASSADSLSTLRRDGIEVWNDPAAPLTTEVVA